MSGGEQRRESGFRVPHALKKNCKLTVFRDHVTMISSRRGKPAEGRQFANKGSGETTERFGDNARLPENANFAEKFLQLKSAQCEHCFETGVGPFRILNPFDFVSDAIYCEVDFSNVRCVDVELNVERRERRSHGADVSIEPFRRFPGERGVRCSDRVQLPTVDRRQRDVVGGCPAGDKQQEKQRSDREGNQRKHRRLPARSRK
jgi:hypothetical protein